MASRVASIAAAAAPSPAAWATPGATNGELMPTNVPQKAAVAKGVGSTAPAARPITEEAATELTLFCTSAHVATEAPDEQAILTAAFCRKALGGGGNNGSSTSSTSGARGMETAGF